MHFIRKNNKEFIKLHEIGETQMGSKLMVVEVRNLKEY